MRVLKVTCDVDANGWYRVFPPTDDYLLVFNGTRRLESWIPPTVVRGYPDRPSADFMGTNFAPLPAVNNSGRRFLEDLLGPWVEFLPLEFDGENRWLAHVLYVSECLDSTKTEFRSSGTIYRYAFHEDVLTKLTVLIFRLKEMAASVPYAAEEVMVRYRAAGLTGLQFEPVLMAN